MAEHTETIELDDSSLFRGAMENEPAPPETPERPRDEQGRFAPRAETEQVTAEPAKIEAAQAAPPVEATEQPNKDDAANVPSWRLREVREAREAAERRAEDATRSTYAMQAEMQAMREQLQKLQTPKAEPVDFFADPDNALNQRIAPIQSDLDQFKSEIRLEMSKELATIKYGEPAVKEMEAAIDQAMRSNHPDVPSLAARMRKSNNPVSVAMDWHKNQKLLTETGGDLNAYKAKVREEALKDPEFMAKVMESARTQAGAAPAGRSVINLPPSLNRTAGSAPNTATDDSDMSDRGLFRHAMAPGRR